MDKGEFIGRAALASQIERGPRRRLVSLVVDCAHAPAHAGDPVFGGGEQVGSVTSGGYGHRVGENIAYAYVAPERAAVGTRLEVGILGERFSAEVVQPVRYDIEFSRVRS